jgi:hypothetical protein
MSDHRDYSLDLTFSSRTVTCGAGCRTVVNEKHPVVEAQAPTLINARNNREPSSFIKQTVFFKIDRRQR